MEKVIVYRCECGFETENENEAIEHEKECKKITIKRIWLDPNGEGEIKFTTEILTIYPNQMLNRNFDEVQEQLGRFLIINYCVETKNLLEEYENKCKKKMIEYYNMDGTISPHINDEELI